MHIKDPKKVAAGSKGGKLSPSNFKHNRAAASRAGKISARKRQESNMPEVFKKRSSDAQNNI